jgi:hypothetical protein
MFVFLVLGFLHGVRSEFTDDVSETAVGPIFTGHDQSRHLTSLGNFALPNHSESLARICGFPPYLEDDRKYIEETSGGEEQKKDCRTS